MDYYYCSIQMLDMNIIKEKCFKSIEELLDKYKNNEYILQRIHNHIVNYLPNTLTYENTNHEKRVSRNNFLTKEQQIFIQIFLNNNKYYYLSSNNCFYEYNSKNYYMIKNDDVIHKLLSTISKDRILLDWKHKTKYNIIKQIKERSLFDSVPETETIQNILNVLYPSVFPSKSNAKYFLTIIGDNILKKNTHLIFLVNQNTKRLLTELDNIAYSYIGYTNTTHNFMTKYHENHSYDNCRLININDNFNINIWQELLKKIGLDLFCVATHYSKRYENSDKYIEVKCDEELKNYAYFLKNNNQIQILDKFCNKYIVVSDDTNKIEWKNLHFIWKQFLSKSSLPSMIYSNTLKNLLKERYKYDEDSDSFLNIVSAYLPIESDFIKFWESTINIINDSDDGNIVSEFEIDELCTLFKIWIKQYNGILKTNGNISEDIVVKILKHFFPNVQIIEEKYVYNITCILWDKKKDIDDSFDYIKNKIKEIYTLQLISFDDAYNLYYEFSSINKKYIISKKFFEKYVKYKLQKYIVYDKFIETDWIMQNE